LSGLLSVQRNRKNQSRNKSGKKAEDVGLQGNRAIKKPRP
jgi:hypothetical protein